MKKKPNDQAKRASEVPVRVVDRRRFRELEDGEASPADREVPDRRPAYVEELEGRLREGEERLQQTLSAHRRMQGEFEEVRARLDRDFQRRVEEAKAEVFRRVLDVADEMDRALAAAEGDEAGAGGSLSEGLRLIHRKLFAMLEEQGVERMELEGEPFDPEVAEALGVVPVDDPAQHDRVIHVVQAGYRMAGRTLRPARVQVGRSQGGESGTRPEEVSGQD
jgi:molecular chaperone GrpE (heat shock protein)